MKNPYAPSRLYLSTLRRPNSLTSYTDMLLADSGLQKGDRCSLFVPSSNIVGCFYLYKYICGGIYVSLSIFFNLAAIKKRCAHQFVMSTGEYVIQCRTPCTCVFIILSYVNIHCTVNIIIDLLPLPYAMDRKKYSNNYCQCVCIT